MQLLSLRLMGGSPDVVVVGAGVFGAWTAYQLRRSGRSITLVDAYAPGNFRASSGGESRVMRIGYGGNESYSRWALRSLYQWQELFRETRRPLFIKSGVLWLGRQNDPLTDATTLTLQKLGMRVELLSRDDLATRFSQFHLGSITRGVFEPESGVILARHAVQTLVTEAARCGVECASAAVTPPNSSGSRLTALSTGFGTQLTAETFVFACGAWLPKLFPKLLTPYIHTTRQEVFFFGPGPGDCQFAPPAMPAWIDFHDGIYGLPDLNGRGVQDRFGPARATDRPRHRGTATFPRNAGFHTAAGHEAPPCPEERPAARRSCLPILQHLERRFSLSTGIQTIGMCGLSAVGLDTASSTDRRWEST